MLPRAPRASALGPHCTVAAMTPAACRRTRAISLRLGVACAALSDCSSLRRFAPPVGVPHSTPPMKITKLTTFVVPPRWCFLKIETDEGITGWGEPVLEGRAHTVAAAVDELSDLLIGKDPALIEDHWTVMYGAGIHMSALAGIDQALWDIKGKALGVPVHQLLGGQLRDRIRVYSWIGGDRPSDTAAMAKECGSRGFSAVKMNATEEMQFVDSHAKVDAVVARVEAIRNAMGPHFGIGV